MEKKTLNLLILEDRPDDAELAVKELEREGFVVEWERVDTEEGFREGLSEKPDMIFADYSLPFYNGAAALQMQQKTMPEIPLIMLSGTIGEDVAVECLKSGATDYVLKDRISRLGPVVKRALKKTEEQRERRRMQKQIIHLNSVLKAIRRINQLVVLEKVGDSLLRKACDAMVEARGYNGVWLGFLGDEKVFATVKGSGLGADISRFREHVIAGDHPSCIEKALDGKDPIIIMDKFRECGDCFFKSACKGKEAAIIHVANGRKLYGLLAILFAPNVFVDDEEKELLKEVAADIGLGLYNIDLQEERKKAEEEDAKIRAQLQKAQKMEAIGTLAGGIAHDLNNILFPILGYTEMILQDVSGDSPHKQGLIAILQGAKRAEKLVQQILAFSRQKNHELKPVKIQLVINEALKLINSTLPSTIETIQNIKSDCGLVLADPTQIHQIVMNLCTNAFHAMEETGGKLTVTLKEVELAAEDVKDKAITPGMYVCLTVSDTGTGMDQSVINRIFDPYFTTKENDKGTGLGLAVVHGIVKSHGGHISLYSEPGKGTEFHVCLPLIKTGEETTKVETDMPIQKGNERILIVDDEDIIVQMEKYMLEQLGYHVTTRTSSTDALEAFKVNPDTFDLVITDMTMPNMTGDKLAVEIMKIRSDMPVILCTGFSEMMSKEKTESIGIKGFLMKPIVMKDFSNMIRKVLDKEIVD